MKPALAVAAIIAAGLGVSGFALRLGDRQTFAAPPDAVMESFTREVASKRYPLAIKYLSRELRRSLGPDAIEGRFAPRLAGLGPVNAVDAELESIDRSHASAKATIEAEHGSVALVGAFVWDGGVWALQELPEATAGPLTPPPGRAPPSTPR